MHSSNLPRRAVISAGLIGSGLTFAGASSLRGGGAAQRQRFAIALHGGSLKLPEKLGAKKAKEIEASLGEALTLGVKLLEGGGASLDAVEQVIRFLEDDPRFNAGRGAVFNSAGGHELDASIMDGKTLACGAVAAVRTVRNPILLARRVMEKTRHVLLVADGAEKFADEMQVERVENSWFDTDQARQEWEDVKRAAADKQSSVPARPSNGPEHYGTVGCVALDTQGNLAAGTSTGGLTNKKYGRVGDSPLIGAGTYADNATCAVSCTGIGEEYIRRAVAYDLSARLAYKQQSLPEAVADVLKRLPKAAGGIIAVDAAGQIVMDFSTGGMSRAAADASGLREVKLAR